MPVHAAATSATSAASTCRRSSRGPAEEAITTLKTGEALVSFLDEHGAPGIVERVTILPPQSYMGAIDAEFRARVIDSSPVARKYDVRTDKNELRPQQQAQQAQAPAQAPQYLLVNGVLRQVVPIGQAREFVQYNGNLWPIL